MDKPRTKRPPDVDEALSSMLWTPYDQTASTSSSDSLSDEDRNNDRKFNRYSNPLPNSCNWWTGSSKVQNPLTLRYSFPYENYYGNYLPQHPNNNETYHATTTTKKTISTTISSFEQAINTSSTISTLVHSFTDDFYQYQTQPIQSISDCQSTHKHHKSQPSLLHEPTNFSINTDTHHHLASQPTNKHYNHRNNTRNCSSNKCLGKSGNNGDLYSVKQDTHDSSSKKQQQQQSRTTYTNTDHEIEGKLKKVTQLAMNNMKHGERGIHKNINNNTNNNNLNTTLHTHGQLSTSAQTTLKKSKNNTTKQASCNRIPHENVPLSHIATILNNCDNDSSNNNNNIRNLDVNRIFRFDEDFIMADELENINVVRGGSDDEARFINHLSTFIDYPQPSSIKSHFQSTNSQSQMPSVHHSSSTSSSSQIVPVKLTNSVSSVTNSSKVGNQSHSMNDDATKNHLNYLCTSSVYCKNDIDYQLKKIPNKMENIENNQNNVNVMKSVGMESFKPSSEISERLNQRNMDNLDNISIANKSINNANLSVTTIDTNLITSAIDNYSQATNSTVVITPSKSKLTTDVIATREKRRRDRRDRRIARTRGTSDIVPDVINNHSPPAYADIQLPAVSTTTQQQSVPSIVSTVPVEDNRYTFSLPLVRRSTSDRSGKDCCGQWFVGPPLRILVVLMALGGIACTLGGATMGATALAGSPTSHLTAGLLMTGVGIVLVTISGVAWRMTTLDAHQCTGRCGRRQCSRGNSSFGLLYPEFQHRPPPPSYQASMQEHRLRLLLLDRERQTSNARASPPPTYRSNAGTLLRPPVLFHQSRSGNVHVEVPPHNMSINMSSSTNHGARGILEEHHSPTSQTITTVASINRLENNEFILTPASRNSTREMVTCTADITSLINQNIQSCDVSSGGGGGEGRSGSGSSDEIVHNIRNKSPFNSMEDSITIDIEDDCQSNRPYSNETLNCTRSSSRCSNSYRDNCSIPSDRNINCISNNDYMSIVTDHNTTAANHSHCINVNNSNNVILEHNNKMIMDDSYLLSTRRSMRDTNFFSQNRESGNNCESGIRVFNIGGNEEQFEFDGTKSKSSKHCTMSINISFIASLNS